MFLPPFQPLILVDIISICCLSIGGVAGDAEKGQSVVGNCITYNVPGWRLYLNANTAIEGHGTLSSLM